MQIVLGGGCFWCLEAIFQRIQGVRSVISGYAGGHQPDPHYQQVCTGKTGHAEVVLIDYDESQISTEQILRLFFASHDPTTLNRQGADVGSQYRSIILYADAEQKRIAQQIMLELAHQYDDPIVTELKPLERFYPAEPIHQNYYHQHAHQPYCQRVIHPKIERLVLDYPQWIKKSG